MLIERCPVCYDTSMFPRVPHGSGRRSTGFAVSATITGMLMCWMAFGALTAGQAWASSAPEVQTEPAEVVPGGARLKGKLDPEGLETTYYFEYARDTCDEGCTPKKTPQVGPATGVLDEEVNAVEVTGLEAGEGYWYELIAHNADGTSEWHGGRRFTAIAPTAPSIESESVSNLAATDATLEATIDPNGRETSYEIWFWAGCSMGACERTGPSVVATGHINPGSGNQTVNVKLNENELEPGISNNEYWIVASNSAGKTESAHQKFATPSSSLPSEVVTEPAEVTPTGVRLKGKLNPEGLPTTYYFRYKNIAGPECEALLDRCGGGKTAESGPLTGYSQQEVPPVEVTGLEAGQTYEYWLVAKNADGREEEARERDFTVAESGKPVIDSVSISHVTQTDGTLEAQINTEGLSTLYQFHLVMQPLSCLAIPACLGQTYSLPSGLLLGSFLEQSVSLDLNSAGVALRVGREYAYWVSATSTAGTTEGTHQMFRVPPGEEAEPLSSSPASSPSTAGQPTGSNTGSNESGQPDASASGGSSSTPGTGVLGAQVGTTTKPKALTNVQKLSNALKVCKKDLKGKRAKCEKQAHKKYGTTVSKAKFH
jgi:hypothetical protein